MAEDFRHRAWLRFLKRIIEVPAGYSKGDLLTFRSIATHRYPAVVRLIDGYLELAEDSDSNVEQNSLRAKPKSSPKKTPPKMHLFDLLRDKRLFPSNLELAQFASRVLPNMRSYRFDKMSKGDIASRIIEYIETSNPDNRERLEASMREALSTHPAKSAERRSFFSKWEKIIKGIEF